MNDRLIHVAGNFRVKGIFSKKAEVQCPNCNKWFSSAKSTFLETNGKKAIMAICPGCNAQVLCIEEIMNAALN